MGKTELDSENVQLPGSSFALIMTAAILVLLFIIFFNYGAYRDNKSAEASILETEKRLMVQKKLFPFYLKLKQKESEKKITSLPSPERKAVPIDSISEIPTMIKDIAKKSGSLHIDSVIPDVNTMEDDSRQISVDIKLQGDFPEFRDFLAGIGGLGSLEKMEEIHIETAGQANLFLMKIWLYVE